MIDRGHKLSIRRQAALLGVSRGMGTTYPNPKGALEAPKRPWGNRNDGMARELLALLVTHSDPRNRLVEAANAKARTLGRFQLP